MSRPLRLALRAVLLYALVLALTPYLHTGRPLFDLLWLAGFIAVPAHLPLIALAGGKK